MGVRPSITQEICRYLINGPAVTGKARRDGRAFRRPRVPARGCRSPQPAARGLAHHIDGEPTILATRRGVECTRSVGVISINTGLCGRHSVAVRIAWADDSTLSYPQWGAPGWHGRDADLSPPRDAGRGGSPAKRAHLVRTDIRVRGPP